MSAIASEIELVAPPGTYAPYKGMRPVAEAAAGLLPTGGSLLDLGCGVGTIALWVARHRPDVSVVGVDINALAVVAAHHNALRLGLDARFTVGDLYEPVDALSFDVITITVPWETEADYPIPPEPLDAYIDRHMTMARALAGASDHLHPGGHVVVYFRAGLHRALELAGLRCTEERTGEDHHIYIAEAQHE